MTEKDIDAMNVIVDNHQEVMENEIQSLVRKINTRLHNSHTAHYTPIIEQLERRLAEQKLKNAAEDKRGGQLEAQKNRTELIISRFVGHISLLRIKERTNNVRSRIFKAWFDLSSGRTVMANTAERLYCKDPMRRILFKRWQRKFRDSRSKRQRRELRRSCEKDIRLRETEATQRVTALQAELSAVKQLLVEHEKQHGEMQQKLRRAFMRGVVNLNLEAMDVFGEIPTADAIPNNQRNIGQKTEDASSDEDDFFIEPAPRISVIRHH